MTYPGHVQNGVVVFDHPAQLPDGTSVRVEVIGSETVRPVAGSPLRRKGGQYAGQISIAPDFDDWPTDIQESLGILP